MKSFHWSDNTLIQYSLPFICIYEHINSNVSGAFALERERAKKAIDVIDRGKGAML